MDLIEKKVNKLFGYVQFTMFKRHVNSLLDPEPCCTCLIKGVPYEDANNAGRINAGIDIINTLCKHYDKYAPIFVDNAEACNKILPVKSQMIKSYVIPTIEQWAENNKELKYASFDEKKAAYKKFYENQGILLLLN